MGSGQGRSGGVGQSEVGQDRVGRDGGCRVGLVRVESGCQTPII